MRYTLVNKAPKSLEKKNRERELPNVVAIETIDENIASKVQEVNCGSSHRHHGSSGWRPKLKGQMGADEELEGCSDLGRRI